MDFGQERPLAAYSDEQVAAILRELAEIGVLKTCGYGTASGCAERGCISIRGTCVCRND